VKFTANAAAAPPHAMDSRRFGLRGAVIDMIVWWWLLVMDMIGLLNSAESFFGFSALFGWLAGKKSIDGWLSFFGQPRTSIPSICRGILQNRCKLSPVLKSHSNPKK
jgi:hypothetical protein